jgi:hypothetical protein
VFWPVTRFPFIHYDDMIYATENDHVQGGLTAQGVWWAFTNIQAAFWHPLTWLSHMNRELATKSHERLCLCQSGKALEESRQNVRNSPETQPVFQSSRGRLSP